jgi:hypothetical protein
MIDLESRVGVEIRECGGMGSRRARQVCSLFYIENASGGVEVGIWIIL